jgi:hypothetical protein
VSRYEHCLAVDETLPSLSACMRAQFKNTKQAGLKQGSEVLMEINRIPERDVHEV